MEAPKYQHHSFQTYAGRLHRAEPFGDSTGLNPTRFAPKGTGQKEDVAAGELLQRIERLEDAVSWLSIVPFSGHFPWRPFPEFMQEALADYLVDNADSPTSSNP